MDEQGYRLSEKCVVPEEWKAGIGHDFRHYKGKMYRLLGLAPHSETLEPSKYLIKTAKRNIEGEIPAAEARKLVDAYYEVKGEHDVPEDAEEADKVAARINQIIVDVGINDANVGINVGINETEEKVIKLLLRNSKFTAAQLGVQLGVEKRHIERIIASLKKKAGLKRRGARKNGEWYFEEP